MREIKFRGKRLDNGEWIYGYLHVIDTLGKGFTGKAIQQQHGSSRPFSVQVDPESVGQYTGLSDKSGVGIYGGDIVKFHDFWYEMTGGYAGSKDVVGEIKYVEDRFVVDDCKDSESSEHDLFVSLINDDEFEVIGNIYSNPELLEER